MFIEVAERDPLYFFSWIGFAAFSICVHESSHARAAVYFGDDTPRDYVPLNPLKQMGWLSLVMLAVIGVAWGAVPVNAQKVGGRVRNAMVYLAGPIANLVLCAIFALLAQTALLWDAPRVERFFYYGSYVNGALFLLNLCPVPPLDGFGVVRSLLIENVEIQQALNRVAGIGLILLWMTPVGSLLFEYGGKLADFFMTVWMAPFRLFA
ncbi:MAG: site-2 protease family protein [Pontiellaceae bacterium]|nr:site-2 protease family protein [Pontiellaceae bacterium]